MNHLLLPDLKPKSRLVEYKHKVLDHLQKQEEKFKAD